MNYSSSFFFVDLLVGAIIVTRDIIEKSCIPFILGSIGCRLTSFIQVSRMKMSREKHLYRRSKGHNFLQFELCFGLCFDRSALCDCSTDGRSNSIIK